MKSRLFFCFVLVATQFYNYLHAMEQNKLSVLFGTHTEQGGRRYQEDTYYNDGEKNVYGVFDGHDGGDVSQYLKRCFGKKFSKQQGTIKNRLKSTFKKCETHCLRIFEAGSTAVVAVVDDNNENLYVVNIGDSRGVFG